MAKQDGRKLLFLPGCTIQLINCLVDSYLELSAGQRNARRLRDASARLLEAVRMNSASPAAKLPNAYL